MSQPATKSVLITGANSGLGKDVARQLALRDDFGVIYLACRNPAKARAAAQDLVAVTGRSIFRVLNMDMCDLDSVRRAVPAIEATVDAVVMNAGGTGGPHPTALTPEGATEIFAANVLGHVVLLEELLAAGALAEVAVLTAARPHEGSPSCVFHALPLSTVRSTSSPA